MLKIKEFADFCNVTVKTLQLYDRMDLFKPAYVDEQTGYRYYQEEQMLALNTIISFKKVGFKLQEITDMKQNGYSKAQVAARLQQKRLEQLRQIQALEYNNENIDAMLQGLGCAILKDSQEEELLVSRLACLENEKLEHDFSQIIWL